jgi:hypothetical protein
MRAVDDVVLARLRAAVGFEVYDGFFHLASPEGGPVVIEYDVPYAVYFSSVGDDDEDTRRLSAHIPRESVFCSLTYVGVDRNQTKAAGEKLRAQMKRWRPMVPGFVCEIAQLLESQRVRRDDNAVRPDGTPLFYGVDNYAVGVRQS